MKYYGVYDFKESKIFRPTIEKRIHIDYPVSKTITTRDDSCCVILSGGGQTMRIRKLTPKKILFYLMGLCGIIDGVRNKENEERIRKILSILWTEIGKKEIQWEIRRFWGISKEEILRPKLYEQSILESWQLQPNGQSCTPNITKNCTQDIELSKCVFSLWENWKNRYSPHRWELSKQQFKQFNAFMSQLSQQDTQPQKEMCNLWETNERVRVLQQALCEIQEIWRSTIPQEQSKGTLRIRKLVPLETMKLMGFTKEDYQAMREIGMTDSQIYHCAGDALVVPLFAMLVGQMLPFEEKDLRNIVEHYIDNEIVAK